MTIFEKLKNWWLGTPKTTPVPESSPYSPEAVIVIPKTEPVAAEPVKAEPPAPAPAACGCGRSDTGLCQGLHLLSEEEWQAKTAKPVTVAEPAKEETTIEPAKTEIVDTYKPVKARKEPRVKVAKEPKSKVAKEPKPKISKTSKKPSK